jgi:hypothetical protein
MCIGGEGARGRSSKRSNWKSTHATCKRQSSRCCERMCVATSLAACCITTAACHNTVAGCFRSGGQVTNLSRLVHPNGTNVLTFGRVLVDTNDHSERRACTDVLIFSLSLCVCVCVSHSHYIVVRVLQPLMETRALLVAQTEPIFASLANGMAGSLTIANRECISAAANSHDGCSVFHSSAERLLWLAKGALGSGEL